MLTMVFFLALHRFQSVFCCADYDVFLFLGVALVFKSVTYEIGIIHVCSKVSLQDVTGYLDLFKA